MAMDGDDGLGTVGHLLTDSPDEFAELLRNRIAHGVGNVHRASTGSNDSLDDLVEIGRIGPAGIHWREFHILDIASRSLYHLHRTLLGLVARHAKLVFQMDIGGREECMDAYLRRPFQCFPSPIDVLRTGAC